MQFSVGNSLLLVLCLLGHADLAVPLIPIAKHTSSEGHILLASLDAGFVPFLKQTASHLEANTKSCLLQDDEHLGLSAEARG